MSFLLYPILASSALLILDHPLEITVLGTMTTSLALAVIIMYMFAVPRGSSYMRRHALLAVLDMGLLLLLIFILTPFLGPDRGFIMASGYIALINVIIFSGIADERIIVSAPAALVVPGGLLLALGYTDVIDPDTGAAVALVLRSLHGLDVPHCGTNAFQEELRD